MRITSLAELRPLLDTQPPEKRRAILRAFEASSRGASLIAAALEAERDAAPAGEPEPKRSKYGNKFVVIEGEFFHSEGEYKRCVELRTLERAGHVEGLERQVEFPICVAGEFICSWYADFRYKEAGRVVVEDFKGYRTEIYRLKKKLVEAIYKIKILETGAKPKRPKSPRSSGKRRRRASRKT